MVDSGAGKYSAACGVWKETLLRQLGIRYIILSPQDWVLLLLAVDGRSPLIGEYVLHTVFYLYAFAGLDVGTLLLAPFSEQLFTAINQLEQEGLIRRKIEYIGGRICTVITLTQRGVVRACELLSKVRESWVLTMGFLLRPGKRVLDELTSLKRVYNGRSVKTVFKLLLDKVKVEDPGVVFRLSHDELTYIKAVIREYELEQ